MSRKNSPCISVPVRGGHGGDCAGGARDDDCGGGVGGGDYEDREMMKEDNKSTQPISQTTNSYCMQPYILYVMKVS